MPRSTLLAASSRCRVAVCLPCCRRCRHLIVIIIFRRHIARITFDFEFSCNSTVALVASCRCYVTDTPCSVRLRLQRCYVTSAAASAIACHPLCRAFVDFHFHFRLVTVVPLCPLSLCLSWLQLPKATSDHQRISAYNRTACLRLRTCVRPLCHSRSQLFRRDSHTHPASTIDSFANCAPLEREIQTNAFAVRL